MIKSIDTAISKIRYSDQGDGSVCVILHGYLESIETFDDLTGELAQHARVICIDLPGHGRSELRQDHVSVEEMAEAVYTIIDRLGINMIHLIGHSMGGYVALAFADKYPGNLLSFSFLHSTANADTPDKRINRTREIEFVRKGKKELICNTAVPNTFSKRNQNSFRDEIANLVRIASETSDRGVIAALNAMINRPDRNDVLKALQIPKYSFIGKEDNFIPFDKGLEWANDNRMKPIIFENSGHMSFIEEKEACVLAIREIMKLK